MATYLIANLLFMALVLLLLRPHRHGRPQLETLIIILVMTAIFDSLIIWAGIVAYDPGKILGVNIGLAPIEDFMYAILAVIIVPALWHRIGKSHV
ncbi:lycopene cyclase domain-containing protein [Candidatus Saccharibacteria bacterium]|nr:lycopene cyclase domain-containing protein [Candidatus Saccharibacteria bacterium]